MEYREFAKRLFEKGKDWFEEAELFSLEGTSMKIAIFGGELDKYSFSSSSGVSLRGIRNGSPGYAYAEILDDRSIDIILEGARDNAEAVDSDSMTRLNRPSRKYPENKLQKANLSSLDTEQKIGLMLELEKKAIDCDTRITSVQECIYQEFSTKRTILNTLGMDLEDESQGGFAYISVVANHEGDTRTGTSYRLFRDPLELDIEDMASEASEEAVTMLGAKQINSGIYPVVIRHNVFADIIESFLPVFSADNVQKGLSGLKGKLGEGIASPILTICDDPFHDKGFAGTIFDDEGIPVSYKRVVDNGILSTYLYNTRSASKENKKSTGNGFRSSYKTAVSTKPTNFYIVPGDLTQEDLIKQAEGGVFITMVAGLHSGLDTVSGDFSVQAQGYTIKDGLKDKPVNEITISGNFFDILNKIIGIGNDLYFGLPGDGHFGSPSILISEASISGK